MRLLCTALLLAVAGCANLGPDYSSPEAAAPAQWASPIPEGVSISAALPGELPLWWRHFDDPLLASLVEQALRESTDLESARARLREARARRALAGANRLPAVDASGSASRSRSSAQAGGGQTRELYSAGFDASWEADLFGRLRRGQEATQAELEASGADLHAAQVTLAAEVALNYVELRATQQRLQIARANLETQSETLQLTVWREQAGLTTALQVDQARTNVAQTRAQIPSLETAIAQARHRLAVLTGQSPGALEERLAPAEDIPRVPGGIVMGIPAETLRQRPDLAAAERRLAAQTARIGEAQAQRYPELTLSGSLGLEALTLASLTGPGAVTRSLAARIAGPLFDAGRNEQSVEIQRALQDQALASWRSTLLTALEEVENALVALAGSRSREQSLRLAAESAREAARLARQRYAVGITDFQTVLDTERTLLTVEDSLKSSEADSASAVIQLYKALGGGWESVPAPAGESS